MSAERPAADTDFVETNVILAKTLEWDDLSVPVSEYLADRGSSQSLVTSARVFEEARRVVEKQRKRIREVAEKIHEDFDPGYFDTIDDVLKFVDREFLDRWDKLDPIKRYIEYYDSGFLGLTDADSESNLRMLYEDIRDDFDDALDLIEDIETGAASRVNVSNITDAPEGYLGLSEYELEYQHLDAFLDDYDRNILLDAFWYTNETSTSPLVFVSFDSDIYSNDGRIEEQLSTLEVYDTTVYLGA
ncbi:hypothetical protein [Halosimplex halobium]|uniref:hypothetical protein n=1 Tax=Halosimplex halobium TaxID=3396618 RepID=UPI003F564065